MSGERKPQQIEVTLGNNYGWIDDAALGDALDAAGYKPGDHVVVTPAPARWKGAVCQSCETEFQCPKCGEQGPGEGTEDREP